MSQFLPDGPYQTQPPSGVADITPTSPETTSADIALMQRVLSAASRNPNLIPPDFMAYVLDWIQTQRLTIPIGQVFGFTPYSDNINTALATANTAIAGKASLTTSTDIQTLESTTSTSYVDLSTVGPQMTGLADGEYIFVYAFSASNSSGGSANHYMNINANGSPPGNDDDAARCTASSIGVTTIGWSVKTLSNSNNSTVKAVYRVDSGATGTPNFGFRRMFALRFGS